MLSDENPNEFSGYKNLILKKISQVIAYFNGKEAVWVFKMNLTLKYLSLPLILTRNRSDREHLSCPPRAMYHYVENSFE